VPPMRGEVTEHRANAISHKDYALLAEDLIGVHLSPGTLETTCY